MAFTWQISINKTTGTGFAYDPNPLDAAVDDEIFWTNNDDKPHFPGLAANPTYFMANQIQPGNSSDTFIPGVSGKVSYIDTLYPTAAGGTINVS